MTEEITSKPKTNFILIQGYLLGFKGFMERDTVQRIGLKAELQ